MTTKRGGVIGPTMGATHHITPGFNVPPSFTSGTGPNTVPGPGLSVGPGLRPSTSYATFSPSSTKTLTIYFNGGALKFKPSMLIPDTKGEDVFFNPTIKYNPKSVYSIPAGQNKKYRYNKFFSSVAFNDQIVSDTLRSMGGKQKLLTLKEATRTRVIDYNIYVTLHALFATNNVLYINKKPYTIYKFNWNEEWQLDTKLSSSFHHPYASESFMRYSKEEEEEAKKMLEEVPEEARMSVKMRENILKSGATPSTAKPSIKATAIRTSVGTSQNLVNVFTPNAIKTAYKSPYYSVIVSQNKKNPITISRPFPNHLKRKEKETNPLARATAASEQNDLSNEFITFTLSKLLYGVNFEETVKKVLSKEEQSAVLKKVNSIPIITDTMFRTLNKFYDAHHPTMSSKLNEIDVLIDPLKNALTQNTVKPAPCRLEAPDNAYFWKWLSSVGNPSLKQMSSVSTELAKKMQRIHELGRDNAPNPKDANSLTRYFANIDEIDEIFKSMGDSFREDVTTLYDRDYLTFMKEVKCVATTAASDVDVPAFNTIYAVPLRQVQQITTKLKDFVSILQDCAATIRDYILSLINYFSQTQGILESFSNKIVEQNDDGDVIKKILSVACTEEKKACTQLTEALKTMMEESPFLNNILFLRYAVSDPLLNENLFIKYSETPGLIDVDFKTLYKYVFEAQIFVLDISELVTTTMDTACEEAHTVVKNLFTKFKDLYIAASNGYEHAFVNVDRDAYESSLKLGGTSLLLQGAATPDPQLVEAYQKKMTLATQLQTIIVVHPQLSYIHCLKQISLSSSERDKAAWALSKIAVSEDIGLSATGSNSSVHTDAAMQTPDNKKDDYLRVMQEFNITNLRKKCAAIMNQTPGNSCEELQLNVVRPFFECLPRYTKGETGEDMQNFYTPPTHSDDDALLQILCDVLNAHLTSFGSSSTHAFFDKTTSSFAVDRIKAIHGIGATAEDKLRNTLIGLKINLIIITKDDAQDTYKAIRYVAPSDTDESASVSDTGSDTASGVSLSEINFTDYIVLFREELKDGKQVYRVFVPINASSIISADNVSKNYAFLLQNNNIDQGAFNSSFASFVQGGGGSAPTSSVVGSNPGSAPTSSVVGSAPVVLNSSVVGSTSGSAPIVATPVVATPVATSSVSKPHHSSLSSQLANMKNIQKMAKHESKLSYYVMIDLVLVPGDKISIMQMANMECKIKADNIQKSLSETFGFAYAPPPLFTDYETSRHDNHGSPHKNPYSVDERDVSKMLAQHEKELNAVLSDSYKKEQDLAMERAMNQVGKNYPSKRGFFS